MLCRGIVYASFWRQTNTKIPGDLKIKASYEEIDAASKEMLEQRCWLRRRGEDGFGGKQTELRGGSDSACLDALAAGPTTLAAAGPVLLQDSSALAGQMFQD